MVLSKIIFETLNFLIENSPEKQWKEEILEYANGIPQGPLLNRGSGIAGLILGFKKICLLQHHQPFNTSIRLFTNNNHNEN